MFEPSNELRFVIRNGLRILQQKWTETSFTDTEVKVRFEWREIDFVTVDEMISEGVETYTLHGYKTRHENDDD